MTTKMLVGYLTDGEHSGIDRYLLNFAAVAAENGVTPDFLTSQFSEKMEQRVEREFGGKLLQIPRLTHPVAQFRAVKQILSSGEYSAAYFNVSEAFNCAGLWAAFRTGIPRRMVHSHSSGVSVSNPCVRTGRTLIHRLIRPWLERWGTEFYACSSTAAQWLFPPSVIRAEKVQIIYNAVDEKRFVYDPVAREALRKEWNIPDGAFVVGHVGHFTYSKNNFFLMDIFAALKRICPEAVLISVGAGEDFDAVVSYAVRCGVADSVRFLGVRGDVERIYSAMDVFVLPSRFEGLGYVGVEAQFSGLPSVFSHEIPREIALSEDLSFLDKNATAQQWAERILSLRTPRRSARLRPEARQNYTLSLQKKQLIKLACGETRNEDLKQ